MDPIQVSSSGARLFDLVKDYYGLTLTSALH